MKRFIFFIAVFLIFSTTLEAKEDEEKLYTVTRVMDAVTLELDNKQTIRLMGVAVPDINSSDERRQKWGKKADDFVKRLVEGRKVWLEYGKEKTDDQGRTWAFVYFTMGLKEMQKITTEGFIPFWGTSGNFMLNRMLVEYGYATVKSPFSFKYRSTFMSLERNARSKGLGMWQDL